MDGTTNEPLDDDGPNSHRRDADPLVDTPGSLPEHRPLREQVQRTLAAPPPSSARPVVVGKRIEADKPSTESAFPTEWVVTVAVLALVIGLMSLFRPDFVAQLTGGRPEASSAPPLGSGESAGTAASRLSGRPTRGPSRVHWGDDLHHYVVTANVLELLPPAFSPSVAPATGGVLPAGSTPVVAADGSTTLRTVPAESLRLVVPTSADALALRALDAGGPVGPLVLLDVEGVVGAPMTRYIQYDGRLIDPASLVVGTRAPTTAPVSEVELLGRLDARPDVEQVTRLAPGLFALATRLPVDDLASDVEGIETFQDDVLLGITAIAGTAPPSPFATAPRAPLPNEPDDHRPVVAVIDTGFGLASSDLAGRWWTNDDTCGDGRDDDMNGFVDDCHGWDFGGNDADPTPEADSPYGDHGTEVATAIAAARNGSGVVGVADGALIMPLKVARPTGVVAMSAVAGAIDYAVTNGADVITIALVSQPGVSRTDVSVLERAIERANLAGVIVVTGAGNDGANLLLMPAWPASFAADYRNVLSVSALGPDGRPAAFSNRGRHVEFAAPGVAVPVASCVSGTMWRSGTSFAAAAVSGAIARVIAEQRDHDVDAVIGELIGRTELVDGVYVLDHAPVIDSIDAAPGGRAPLDATCRAAGP